MEILLEMEFFENAVLIDGLCNHMKPAINRMKQGVFTENQYIDFLEEKYSKVYVATIKACEFLKEELHIKKLPEGEMGFIALYFCVAVSYTHLDVYKRQDHTYRCPDHRRWNSWMLCGTYDQGKK